MSEIKIYVSITKENASVHPFFLRHYFRRYRAQNMQCILGSLSQF